MPRTQTEKRILASRQQTETILVHKLNELLKMQIGIETEADAEFLHALAMKQVFREKQRKQGNGVYSPSGLASCLRRVYLGKNWKKLGLDRVELPAIEAHYYFLTGDFIHLKWQFAMFKLGQVDPNFMLIDCEVPVMSKHGDHGGTIDVVCINEGELQIVDVKGLNVRSFHHVDDGKPPIPYRIQVTDYMMLWNAEVTNGKRKPTESMMEVLGSSIFPKIHTGLILAENKGGPDARHPGALAEYVVKLKDNLPEVRSRLEILRAHEEEQSIPHPECTSTRGIDFQGCPFADFCKPEVKRIEREAAENRDSTKFRLAKPKRADRPRQSRSK